MTETATSRKGPLRLALIGTTYTKGTHTSHAELFVRRWLDPPATDPAWGWPGPRRSALVAMHFDQVEADGRLQEISRAHDVPLCASVHEALANQGGTTLAVDGVLLIGEHGEYGCNHLGQKLYPRKRMFDEIVATFDACGRSVPVFNDKHFSYRFEEAREMVDTAEARGFLLFGGSTLPHCRHAPDVIAFTDNALPEEVVAVYRGGVESYGFHILEFLLSVLEHRPGGERGVRAVTAYHHDELWRALDTGAWSGQLMKQAIHSTDAPPRAGDVRENTGGRRDTPAAFVLEHVDGFQSTVLNLSGHLAGWGWGLAVRRTTGTTLAAHPVMGGHADFHGHFARLCHIIEEAFCRNVQPFPMQRTLLASGLTDAVMQARAQPGKPLPTPALQIAYQPSNCSSTPISAPRTGDASGDVGALSRHAGGHRLH